MRGTKSGASLDERDPVLPLMRLAGVCRCDEEFDEWADPCTSADGENAGGVPSSG